MFSYSDPLNTSKTKCIPTRSHKALAKHCVFATGALTGCLGATKTLDRHGVFATGALTGCLGGTKTPDRHGVFATGALMRCLGGGLLVASVASHASRALRLGATKTLDRRAVSPTGALKRSTGVAFRPQGRLRTLPGALALLGCLGRARSQLNAAQA